MNWKSIHGIKWNDELISEVKSYLKDNKIPSKFEDKYMPTYRFKKLYNQFSYNPEDNHLYLIITNVEDLKSFYKNDNNELLFETDLPKKLRVVENEDEKQKIMSSYYSSVMANGFRSGRSFYEKLSTEFIGISRSDVEKFVKNQEIKQIQLPTTMRILQPIVVEKPMIHHEIDLIDMSAFSKLNNGITFVLNVIDVHSKFLWSRPIKNKSMESVCYELQSIYLVEGPPKVLSSDQGPEFINDKMKELCIRFNIEQRKTNPFNPQANGICERVNKTLKEMIFAYMAQFDTKNYVGNLQQLVFSYNSSKHGTTKFTPFQLHRHRDVQFSIVNQMAHENIKKNADKMIQQSLKKQELDEIPLQTGDHVRLSSLASKDVRRKGVLHKRRAIRNWSQTLYEVVDTREDNGIEKYKINIHEYEDRWFFRHELQYVDMENLNKTKTSKDKEDLNFGVHYDSEKHIKELSSKKDIEQKLNEDQNKLEEEEKKKEEKEENEIRKSNRNRKRAINEFFVDF